MNFSREEVDLAFKQLGEEAPLIQLVDCIVSAQGAGFSGGKENDHVTCEIKVSTSHRRLSSYDNDDAAAANKRFKVKHHLRDDRGASSSGFVNTPWLSGRVRSLSNRSNLGKAPYFLYGNVVGISKDTWQKLSPFLFDVQPEFVNCELFSALTRKEGYIHDLPAEKRSILGLNSPMTIEDTVRFRIEDHMQPHQLEQILGYPSDHTDMVGLSLEERIAAMRFGFQIDTVGHLFSVLKEMYPDGLKVLSIDSGVGGAELALHRLAIPLKCVVSIEESEVNRRILKRWWTKTGQAGQLRQFSSIKKLNTSLLKDLTKEFAGFDLVVGGTYNSTCRGGTTISSRMGMDFCHFNEYVRVVQSVKSMDRVK